MAKIMNRGFAKPDDPIYTGGPEVFTPYSHRPPPKDVLIVPSLPDTVEGSPVEKLAKVPR